MENLQLHSKNSPAAVIQRQRTLSDPRNRVMPVRPPPPSFPPPTNPRLSGLIGEYRIPSGVHVIDSRSKTPPTRRLVSLKTTKYGTPPPSRPAPPPPNKKSSPQHQIPPGPVPKPRNSPVPKPRSSPVPKPRNPQNSNQTLSSSETELQDSETMATATKEAVDKSFPVYEDLDKEESHYEAFDPSSSSEDENEVASGTQEGPSSSGETPPALPPKKGSKVKKEEEEKEEKELPPLPPRSHPATNIRKHRLLTNHKEDDDRNDSEEEKEAVQDTGRYEQIDFESDHQSQGLSYCVYCYIMLLMLLIG